MGRNYSAVVTMGAVDVSDKVTGVVSIRRAEGQSNTVDFNYLPPSGAIDPAAWAGADVVVSVTDSNSSTQTEFTGKVNSPGYDMTTGVAAISSSNNRDELLAAMSKTAIDALTPGAFWSQAIFETAGNFEYARDRLRTVAGSLDFNGVNTAAYAAWKPKATADRVIKGHEIKRGSVTIQQSHRSEVINRINIDFKYRYERLRHREIAFSYSADSNGSWCVYLDEPGVLCYRDQVEAAIEGTNWPLKSAVSYTDLPPEGIYNCLSGNIPFVMSDVERAKYCWGADFTITNRWTQAMTEAYSVTVDAPQSIAQYGVVERFKTYGLSADYDSDEWEAYDTYSLPTGYTTSANGDLIIDKDDVADADRSVFENGIQAAIGLARSEMLATHRKNYLQFSFDGVDVGVDLADTLEISALITDIPEPQVPPINVVGKVVEIIHNLDVVNGYGTTTVKLALSKIEGAAPVEVAISPPTAPDMSDSGSAPGAINLIDYNGNHSTSPAYDDTWDGLIGNYTNVDIIGSWPQYPEEFALTIDELTTTDRQEREVAAASTFEIEIPNDTLVINA